MSGPDRGEADPLDTADDALVAAVDAAMAEAARLAGPLFGCGAGRTDCGETIVAFALAGRPRAL